MPELSASTTFIEATVDDASSAHPRHLHHLAAQILHNLRFQHDWTSLRVHTHSSPTTSSSSARTNILPRPIVSGIPPRRVYIHPDEQIELIKAGVKDEDVPPEREWILPSHLREKWTLRRFADVFDQIEAVPPGLAEDCGAPSKSSLEMDHPDTPKDGNKWRNIKRLLLATVDDDSTIVYYVVHNGIVKPRQN